MCFTSSYVFCLADTAKAKIQYHFYSLRPVCLHKPRLSTDTNRSLRREAGTTTFGTHGEGCGGQRQMLLCLYRRAGLHHFCVPFKGDWQERRQGFLEPFLLNVLHTSKGTRFVSPLNYQGLNTAKAKALLHLFPCASTQHTETSRLDSSVTYAQNCLRGFCTVHNCVL